MPEPREHTAELDGLPIFWRSAEAAQAGDGAATPVYLHGVPTSSDDWVPFLERSGGLAPDLPGFGRSGKPGYLRYTMAEYDRFIERFLEQLGVERVSLVVHDWGGVGLLFAQQLQLPDDCDPRGVQLRRRGWSPATGDAIRLLDQHRAETAGPGRPRGGLEVRGCDATPGPMPKAWIDSVLAHFDQGTQRAILRLYRSSPESALEAAGAGLRALRMPALVVWGLKDPYLPPRFGRAYAEALPGAELLELPDAGHWPWLDRPDVVERVVAFLGAG